MKTLLSFIVVLLISCSSIASNPTKPLTIHGIFLAKSTVSYEIYQLVNSDTVLISSHVGFRQYTVDLVPDNQYIVRFKKGKHVKNLYIDAIHPDELELDVDFASKNSAIITYNKTLSCYQINPKY